MLRYFFNCKKKFESNSLNSFGCVRRYQMWENSIQILVQSLFSNN